MSLLKQIEDKGAVLEWSPMLEYPNLVALGTKDSAGVGFDDFGGEIELHRLDLADSNKPSTTLLGKARANSRFASIAWSQMVINNSSYPYGLIAGGMVDGNIHVWDPARLAMGDSECLLASVEQHQGAINGLHFNPHKESSHLLASGGADCEVYVTSIERPDQPSVFVPAPPPNNAKHTADITKVAWNTQVVHILASASQNGSCFIWDLRQKKAWCELRDPSGGSVSDVAWNPDQGLHLVTASGDDKNPVLKLWDLRSSTSLPLATLQGHTEGILSISWCPSDPSLLLSCGKDNRTILWDLFNLQPVYELPSSQSISGENDEDTADKNVFGGFASSAGQRRQHVSWSPCIPAVISTSTFDRRVQFYSLTGAKSKIGRAPKWLRKPVGATFGFGGKLVSFDNVNAGVPSASGAAVAGKKAVGSFPLKISQVMEDPQLVASSDEFHDIVARGEYKHFCELKSTDYQRSEQERQVWGLMNVICFGANAREELLTYLGFDSASITATAEEYVKTMSVDSEVLNQSGSAEDLFNSETTTIDTPKAIDLNALSPAVLSKSVEMAEIVVAGEKAEPMIRQAIIVGNFEAAVDCCLQAGLMAEALLLAQCGDQALRMKTQAVFFEKQRHKHPFLNVLHAVIKNELLSYVNSSDLNKWRETLALLSTYGKSAEFPLLCEALAARLELELHDPNSATLCFMCAANVTRTIGFWTAELNAANRILGQIDTVALQNYIEKVVVFTHSNPIDNLGEECSFYFSKYADLLANQGRLDIALSYLKGSSLPESILIDRLYHAGNKKAGSRPPAFPFTKVVVDITAPTKQPQVNAAVTKQAEVSRAQVHPTATVDKTKPVIATVKQTSHAEQHLINNIPSATNATPASTLPPGWIQLIDPASGHPYFVNQVTNQSQWEPPVAVPAVVQSTPNFPTNSFTHEASQPINNQATFNRAGSFQQPVSATTFQQPSQLQQPQIMNPIANQPKAQPVMPTVVEPAIMKPVAATEASKPAVSSTINTVATNAPTQAEAACVAELGIFLENLSAAISVPAEKKQLDMVKVAYSHLSEKLSSNQISGEVLQKLAKYVEFMIQRNFSGANAIQTDLTNTAWSQHKEWIKGLKILIQLASKK